MKRKEPEGGFKSQSELSKEGYLNSENELNKEYNSIELAVLDLFGLCQKNLITVEQKKNLGEQILRGNQKIYKILKEIIDETRVEIIQERLSVFTVEHQDLK